MNARSAHTTASGPSRRAVATGLAWSVPAVAMVSAAPSFAASLRKDPGINGWVLNSPTNHGGCRYSLEVNSAPSRGGATPDGAPWGLYLYDVQPGAVITNPQITYWIIGNQTANWDNITPGHGRCCGNASRGTPQTKSDGLLYPPYTWTYSNSPSCALNPANVDGNGRLDVINRRASGSTDQYELSDSGTLRFVRRYGVPAKWYQNIELVPDVNGDGRDDLRGVSSGGRMRTWTSTGTGWTMTTKTSTGWDRYRTVAVPGDAGGADNKQGDIVAVRPDGDSLLYFAGKGGSHTNYPRDITPSMDVLPIVF